MKQITVDTFQSEVLDSNKLVVADFYADWCGPCRMLAPVLEQVEQSGDGSFEIVKINTDQNQPLAMQFEVMTIPTLIFFRGGEIIDRTIGFMTAQDLKERIEMNK